jgi:hypothetical protein
MPVPGPFVWIAGQARPQPQDRKGPQPAGQFTFPVTAAYSATVTLEACSLLLVA